MAGSWKRTITTPFRKACTILSPQHPHQADSGGEDKYAAATTKAGRRRRQAAQLKESLALAAPEEEAEMEYGGGEVAGPTSMQLYGDVMACAYEDVQVMWSMLDNKARVAVLDATS